MPEVHDLFFAETLSCECQPLETATATAPLDFFLFHVESGFKITLLSLLPNQ